MENGNLEPRVKKNHEDILDLYAKLEITRNVDNSPTKERVEETPAQQLMVIQNDACCGYGCNTLGSQQACLMTIRKSPERKRKRSKERHV